MQELGRMGHSGFVMLVLEGQTQGFQIWGNFPDATATETS